MSFFVMSKLCLVDGGGLAKHFGPGNYHVKLQDHLIQ